MNATIEEEKRIQRQFAKYKMPEARRGDTVLFFPHGAIGRPIVANILIASDDSVELLANGTFYEGVRHVSDPRTKRGPEHCEPGTWDRTDTAKEFDAALEKIEKLESELVNLERRIVQLETPEKK